MKKHVQVKDSYNTWNPSKMKKDISDSCEDTQCKTTTLTVIEWWIHNIGYWLTLPFTFIASIGKINSRFKDVDLDLEEEYAD